MTWGPRSAVSAEDPGPQAYPAGVTVQTSAQRVLVAYVAGDPDAALDVLVRKSR